MLHHLFALNNLSLQCSDDLFLDLIIRRDSRVPVGPPVEEHSGI